MKKLFEIMEGLVLVLAGAGSFAIGTYYWSSEPSAAHWFEASNMHIADTSVGISPSLSVDRIIKKDFRGTWLVAVESYSNNRDTYYVYCTATGTIEYRPGRVLPDDINLDWWTWPTKCDLKEGSYQVTTTWIIYPEVYSPKEVTITSNVFKVGAKAL